ncbi:MAG: hypothetical protein AAFO74_16295 [Pseudomonadota bacterium]
MLPTLSNANAAPSIAPAAPSTQNLQNPVTSDETKLKFEQLLWAELLTHTGLEDSLTLGGGQGASMFARYFVEAVAADIAEQHPLGLLDTELPTDLDPADEIGGESNG